MHIKICTSLFDPWQEVQAYQNANQTMAGRFGATNIFIGTMRDFNENNDVQSMTLEHYPGMTEKQLTKIVEEAEKNWPLIDLLVVHRVGEIFPSEPIVLVAVWTSHRGDAFDSCRFIMEGLKSKAPFWKKEHLHSERSQWIEKNTDGYLQ
jgi:molybdopterin synthase catalytic subunit